MANTTQISIRIDEELKKNVEDVLNDMGLSMSSAITVFLKKVCKERRIPFEISAGAIEDGLFKPLTEEQIFERIDKGIADIENGNYKNASTVEAEIRQEFNL